VSEQPIAVFDSGLGGLSVVREIQARLPGEEIVYFGDTARVPYGTKSQRTVVTFALEDARFLLQFDPKLIVVACNTASALAMDELVEALPLPVVGVVQPGAETAVCEAHGGAIAVIGTEATIQSGAYRRAIHALDSRVHVVEQACPLLVPLVEEGRAADDPIVRLAARTYIEPLRAHGLAACVLGCTHYPLLRAAIAEHLDARTRIIESGRAVAAAVERLLSDAESLCRSGRTASIRCYVSDNPARFRRIGSRFLGHDIEHVEFVEPERYISSAALEP
jgi:glutamate racemase